MNNYKKYNTGFTLIEMMVTIAIVGIFASLALPSFSALIESNRINTATNELVSNLHLTRSEALKRRNTVTLCPSSNQTACLVGSETYSTGWIVFKDCDGDGVIEAAAATSGCDAGEVDEIIKVHDGFDSIYMNNATTKITYTFSGRSGDNSTFDIGKDSGNLTKEVVISRVGRVSSVTL